MRVYELSKKIGLSNKELLDKLQHAGFEGLTHMSALSQEAIDSVAKPASGSSQKQPVQEPEKAKPVSKIIPEKPAHQAAQQAVETPKVMQQPVQPSAKNGGEITLVLEPMTVAQVAQKIHKPVSEVIVALLKQGFVSPKNQLLPIKTIEHIARHYGIKTAQPAVVGADVHKLVRSSAQTHSRSPVVVIIGHVDHGKTTLLDFIRKTKVAAKEQGGITQHLGAYQVSTAQGNIVFLDTPGHAAFTKMRARGVKVADIAVLVVAADDGVMPQTVEALKHAKAVQVPIIVAINKIDKATPMQIETVKRQLAQHDLVPEEWGGQVLFVPLSAKTGQGIDNLLEMIILQSQLMELTTNEAVPAKGFVLEARMEKGRGAVATVLCHEGTLAIGDYFIAGNSHGKVSSLMDSHGRMLKKVAPSIPVQVAGFSVLPEAGDSFEVVSQERYKNVRSEKSIVQDVDMSKFAQGESINLLIKVDTKSSKEALLGAIDQLPRAGEKSLHIVYAAVGDISESDVTLAAATQAIIYGFHVKPEANALVLAQKNNVTVKLFQIIYRLLDDVALLMKQEQAVKMVRTKIGEAVVRRVFETKNEGTIAGSYVKEGRFSRNGFVIVWRGKNKIGEGPIKSLQRDRKTVKEVHADFECAFIVDGYNDWQVDDRVECFLDMPA
jgi:translation initiation factor IF-2